MSKKPDVRVLQHRQTQGQRSEIQMRERAIQAGAPPVFKKTAIASNIIAEQRVRRQGEQGAVKTPQWEPHLNIYNALAQGIVNYAETVKTNLEMVTRAGKNDQNFENIVRRTIEDCQRFSEQLIAIKAKHEHKQGKVMEVDVALYQDTGGEYNALYQQFQILTFQSGIEITTYLSSVVDGVNKDQNLQKLVAETLASAIAPNDRISDQPVGSESSQGPLGEPGIQPSESDGGDEHPVSTEQAQQS